MTKIKLQYTFDKIAYAKKYNGAKYVAVKHGIKL